MVMLGETVRFALGHVVDECLLALCDLDDFFNQAGADLLLDFVDSVDMVVSSLSLQISNTAHSVCSRNKSSHTDHG